MQQYSMGLVGLTFLFLFSSLFSLFQFLRYLVSKQFHGETHILYIDQRYICIVGGLRLLLAYYLILCISLVSYRYSILLLPRIPYLPQQSGIMEASQPLSIESFSYSWLVNLKPSLESLDNSFRASLDASDEASFIEMDPKMPPSKRFFRNSQDFKFDFPISPSSLAFVHADELFSNGYVMPLFFDQVKMEAYSDEPDSSPSLPSSSPAPKVLVPNNPYSPSFRRCRRLSKHIFQKYLEFLRPLFRKLRWNKSSSKAESVDKRVHAAVKNWVYSSETSPRVSLAYAADDWRRSCDSESSIYEAVLHCKRSIGMSFVIGAIAISSLSFCKQITSMRLCYFQENELKVVLYKQKA